jgi:serine/threonine-protein kinase
VYDVGEQADRLFLTMEYVDGEDLSSLISRIGRLPPDKVTEIGRQICAGLAAAHAKGVIHRDLKPANIMIDGNGNVRITDFGIAVQQGDDAEHGVAGTPAYMAPEQFTGGEVGPATDLYALGLILHELLTGHPVFRGSDLSDILKQKMRREPDLPSAVVSGVDSRLDAVIHQSLHRTPSDRPQSALAVAAMLPGGDPLGMAVEVGATLKPSAVAAATLQRPIGGTATWSLIGALLAILVVVLVLADPAAKYENVRDFKAPEVLADRAERMIRQFGYVNTAVDSEWGFIHNPAVGGQETSTLFWYRQRSPRAVPDFVATVIDLSTFESDIEVPEAVTHESILLMLDQAGRLVYLHVGPYFGDAFGVEEAGNDLFDWSALLAAAGLADGRLQVESSTVLPVLSDARASWTASIGGEPDRRVRAQAAALAGRPVYFAVEATDPGAEDRWLQVQRRSRIRRYVATPLYLIVVMMALTMGAYNAVNERCDLRGAGVLVVGVLAVEIVAILLGGAGPPNPLSSGQLAVAGQLLIIVTASLGVGLCYVGLEPFVRRRRPQTLIAWSRLLAGRIVDRAVGTGLLVGAVAGSILVLIAELDRMLVPWLGLESTITVPGANQLNAVAGLGPLLGTALDQLHTAIVGGVLILFLAVALGHFIKVRWLAPAIFVVLIGVIYTVNTGANLPLSLLTNGVPSAMIALFLLHRFGLFTFVAADLVHGLLSAYPMTTVSKLWFAQGGYFAIVTVALVGVIGFLLIRADRNAVATSSGVE